MKVLLITLSVLVASVLAEQMTERCREKCAKTKCPTFERADCLAGTVKAWDGDCNCCDVCARFEGQKCDMPGAPFKHGECGDSLMCKNTTGGDVCQCMWDEVVCGSDGITYNNLCQLMSASVRTGQKTLLVDVRGPCEPGAKIVTAPEYVRNVTDSNAVLVCEAVGYPVPSIHWTVTKANEKTSNMPGDDSRIVTAMRGGPGKFQVTSWLQIEGLKKRHEGDYTCYATNDAKVDKATARIKVIN